MQFLLCADNLMLLAEKEEYVENNLRILDDVMAMWQMKMNLGKTKAMVMKRSGVSRGNVHCGEVIHVKMSWTTE